MCAFWVKALLKSMLEKSEAVRSSNSVKEEGKAETETFGKTAAFQLCFNFWVKGFNGGKTTLLLLIQGGHVGQINK